MPPVQQVASSVAELPVSLAEPDRLPARAPATLWQQALRRFARQRVSVVAAVALGILSLAAIFAPLVAPYDPGEQFRIDGFDAAGLPVGPGAQFWFGTDALGRDLLSRLIYGGRIALTVGLVASGISVVTGVLVGSTAAMAGRQVDNLIMRFVDVIMSLPTFFIILLFLAISKPSLATTIFVISIVGWTYPARIFRAQTISLIELDFITAARSLGMSDYQIFLRHILPHLLPLIIIYAGLGVPSAIFFEASLSFLGLGVPPPTPSWGRMLQDGTSLYRFAPLQVFLPGLAIMITVMCFNLLGSGLRDALDPTVRKG